MTWLDALILGILQGVTEFLPVSSSGHLVIGEALLGLKVEALKSFDVAVHLGTLTAILVYFWKDFWGILRFKYNRILGFIVLGTVPAVLVAVFFEDQIDAVFRNVNMVAGAMIVVGLIFFVSEFVGGKLRACRLTWWKVLIIGCAQAVALIPGVSRSGSTISAGLFQGISREKSARFSFLLGAPAIFGAGIWTTLGGNGMEVEIAPVLIGFFTSAVVGFLAVWFLMRFLKKHSLNWFGGYLIVLGLLLVLS